MAGQHTRTIRLGVGVPEAPRAGLGPLRRRGNGVDSEQRRAVDLAALQPEANRLVRLGSDDEVLPPWIRLLETLLKAAHETVHRRDAGLDLREVHLEQQAHAAARLGAQALLRIVVITK